MKFNKIFCLMAVFAIIISMVYAEIESIAEIQDTNEADVMCKKLKKQKKCEEYGCSIGVINDDHDLTSETNTTITSCYYTMIEIVSSDDSNNNNNSSNSVQQQQLQQQETDIENLDFTINTDDNQLISNKNDTSTDNIAIEYYYLCLVCDLQRDINFGMFHLELSDFCNSIANKLNDASNQSSSNTSSTATPINKILSEWYYQCIEYISRSIVILKDYLEFIIHSSLSGHQFKVTGPTSICHDIITFIKTISISNLSTTILNQNNPEGVTDNDNEIISYLLVPVPDNNSNNNNNIDNDINNEHNDKKNNNIFELSINSNKI
eukprot:gene6651-8228_t